MIHHRCQLKLQQKKKGNRLGRREKLAQKSREEGEIGSESREKGDLPPVPPLCFIGLFSVAEIPACNTL